jgi:hypothetical protein
LRCECPNEAKALLPVWWFEPQELKARIHKPNECLGDYNLKRYRRGTKLLTLCSACWFPSDEEVYDG